MKKNITINLFGQLYNIDEEAYELLNNYEKNITAYFSKYEDGEEVTDDIKHRIAELFCDLRAQGKEIVTIEDVQQIIEQIGEVEDITDESESEEKNNSEFSSASGFFHERKLERNMDDKVIAGVISGLTMYLGLKDSWPWRIVFVILSILAFFPILIILYIILWAVLPTKSPVGSADDMSSASDRYGKCNRTNKYSNFGSRFGKSKHRLYRNLQDQTLGGVISGLTTYFGFNDPQPWRILFVLLTIFMGGLPFIVYLVLWGVIPPAITAEQQLELQGKPVNLDSIREKVIQESQHVKEESEIIYEHNYHSVTSTFGKIIVFLVIGLIMFVLTILLIASVLGFLGIMLLAINEFSFVADFFPIAAVANYGLFPSFYIIVLIVLSVSAIIFIVMMLRCFHNILRRHVFSKGRSLKIRTSLLLVSFIVLIITLVSFFAAISMRNDYSKYKDKIATYEQIRRSNGSTSFKDFFRKKKRNVSGWENIYMYNTTLSDEMLFSSAETYLIATQVYAYSKDAKAKFFKEKKMDKGAYEVYLAYKPEMGKEFFKLVAQQDTIFNFSLESSSLSSYVEHIELKKISAFEHCDDAKLEELIEEGWRAFKVKFELSESKVVQYGFEVLSTRKRKGGIGSFLCPIIVPQKHSNGLNDNDTVHHVEIVSDVLPTVSI